MMKAVNPRNVAAEGSHQVSRLVVWPNPRCAGRGVDVATALKRYPTGGSEARNRCRGGTIRAKLPPQETCMPKFLCEAGYTAEGLQGLVKDSAAGRRAAVLKAVKGLGGKLEAFYYSFGD